MRKSFIWVNWVKNNLCNRTSLHELEVHAPKCMALDSLEIDLYEVLSSLVVRNKG
jgi:hypothetical protein